MDNWITTWSEIITIIAGTLAIIGGIPALWAYAKNSNLNRAKWLESLFARFYESGKYDHIRHIIDYDNERLTALLESADGDGTDPEVPALNLYLNFFGFVALLKKNKELSIEEVKDLFEYDLAKCESLRDYLKKNKFKVLLELLDELKKQKI
jgi:hypothetical protein